MSLLEVDGLRAGYGRIEVLHGISLRLEADSLCAIVGANGAGKTTLLMALSRLLAARAGRVVFDGRDITYASSHAVVRAGLSHVPEGRRMLATLSVAENLLVAAGSLRGAALRAGLAATYERFPILGERRALPAGSLSGGEQQMLALARALIANPKALLLDEPSMGLAPKLVERIFEIIAAERARGTAILLVEQNARKALALADYAYVLERGTISLEGRGADLLGREEITAAYLGEGTERHRLG
ncbi:MAG: ABC transporter ATP-binding protein [Candidatus Eremiobacteraeota bacterium]|nr:ABC transporter ATP-binding protein [Candidatus Eremiobacteraeota bacterium]